MKLTERKLRKMIREEMSISNFDDFTMAFLEALIWSEMDPDTMEPLEDNYDISDIDDKSLKEIKEDCKSFQEAAGEAIEGREKSAGHDFCFTRNGHGAGFWDGDWPEHEDFLTDLAKGFGEISLMPDGKGGLSAI